MFDFERLDVYQLVREQNQKVLRYIYEQKEIDDQIKDQWKRASMNIVLYLAEATGKMNNKATVDETGCSAVRLAHLLWELPKPGSPTEGR